MTVPPLVEFVMDRKQAEYLAHLLSCQDDDLQAAELLVELLQDSQPYDDNQVWTVDMEHALAHLCRLRRAADPTLRREQRQNTMLKLRGII